MKILLAAPRSEDTLGMIGRYCERAVKSLGYEVEVFDFRQSLYLESVVGTSIKSKIKRYVPGFHRVMPVIDTVRNKKINKNLFEFAADYKPDILLVLKGENIFPETLIKIRNELNVITANWFLDTVFSPYSEISAERISLSYDYFFMIDSKDVLEHVKIGSAHVEWLPSACDPSVHKTIELGEEDIEKYKCDVCFTGTLVPERERVLEELVGFDLSIWGPPRNAFGSCLDDNSKLKKFHRGRGVYEQELTRVYNASKIVLSITTFYGNKSFDPFSVTPRLFEVAGCGTFHIVDQQEQIADLYKIGEEVICYSDVKQLRDLVKFYLEHAEEREAIAKRGQQRAYRDHTYVQRIKRMIQVIEESE